MSHVRAGHWSFLVVPLLVGPLCACGMSTAKPHAEAAVAEFHKQMNAGDYHAIWNGADDAFKSSASREQYDQLMAAIARKLGHVVSTSNEGWQVKSHNLKTLTVLSQSTRFERGSGAETFTFVEAGGKARLLGYNINSMDLMTQ